MATGSKKDDESGINQYYHNKTTVLQEARVFNESPISPRKCRALLAQIVYLLYVGETFGTQEATTLFFGVTKLFQHKDVSCVSMTSVCEIFTSDIRVRCGRPYILRSRSWQPRLKMLLWLRAV